VEKLTNLNWLFRDLNLIRPATALREGLALGGTPIETEPPAYL